MAPYRPALFWQLQPAVAAARQAGLNHTQSGFSTKTGRQQCHRVQRAQALLLQSAATDAGRTCQSGTAQVWFLPRLLLCIVCFLCTSCTHRCHRMLKLVPCVPFWHSCSAAQQLSVDSLRCAILSVCGLMQCHSGHVRQCTSLNEVKHHVLQC